MSQRCWKVYGRVDHIGGLGHCKSTRRSDQLLPPSPHKYQRIHDHSKPLRHTWSDRTGWEDFDTLSSIVTFALMKGLEYVQCGSGFKCRRLYFSPREICMFTKEVLLGLDRVMKEQDGVRRTLLHQRAWKVFSNMGGRKPQSAWNVPGAALLHSSKWTLSAGSTLATNPSAMQVHNNWRMPSKRK